MPRVKFRYGLILVAIVILTGSLFLICYIFPRTTKLSHQDTGQPFIERDYVLHQEIENEYTKFRSDKARIESIKNEQSDIKPDLFVNKEPPHKDDIVASLKTLRGKTPIFVYPPEVDNMISSRLRDYGTWEEDLLNETAKIFRKFPDLVFLDVGCNIGVYTLFVAKLGVPVVSVDPVVENLRLLSESLRVGKLAPRVMLISNGISDTRRNTSVSIPGENVGGAYIDDADKDRKGQAVQTIILDDLARFLKGKKVFIKIDIEGHEHRALSAGQTFFQSVDVRGILMEWMHHRRQDSGQTIIDILVKNGLLPYEDVNMQKLLNPDRYYMWPENVFWFKR